MPIYYILGAVAVLLLLILLTSLICFYMVFYSKSRRELGQDEYEIPPGRIYEPFRERMIEWIKQMRTLPHEDVSIVSHDGLTLRGRYYEYRKGATVELLFHGYRGNSERDLCGAVDRCFSLGRNALIVDQRASGKSDGHVISFGINEHRDCLSWIDFAVKQFGPDVKIILTGISMGAATVLTAAALPLPENVVGILADCGYSSPEEVLLHTARGRHLPGKAALGLLRLGGRLFGHDFHVEEWTALECVKEAKVPILLIHGEGDGVVPCDMARQMKEVCAAPVTLLTVPGAPHAMSFYADNAAYTAAVEKLIFENL